MSGAETQRPPIRSIGQAWALYEATMRRRGASDREIFNLKAAFYTGSTAVLDVMFGISSQDVSDDIGVTVVDGLHRETRAFAAEMLSTLAESLQKGQR